MDSKRIEFDFGFPLQANLFSIMESLLLIHLRKEVTVTFGVIKQVEEKIDGYQKFWNLETVQHPIIGFDVGGFFPFQWFGALREIKEKEWLQPEHLIVEKYLEDYTKLYKRSSSVNDDLIKGVSPIPAIPWIEAMLGCPVEISGESIR